LVEADSRWAANPFSMMWGWVAFPDDKRPVERMVPINQPKPDFGTLPDIGAEWKEQWSIDLKCLDGVDAGLEVTFKSATDGGIQCFTGLADEFKNRLNNGGQQDGRIVAVLTLGSDSYPNKHGRIHYPVISILDWIPMGGPAPAPSGPPQKPPP